MKLTGRWYFEDIESGAQYEYNDGDFRKMQGPELRERSYEAELVSASGININISGDDLDKVQSVSVYFKGDTE